MKLSISDFEVSEFLKDFTGQDISVKSKPKYLEITIDIDFKLFTKSCTFVIESITVEQPENSLIITYSSKTFGLDLIVSGLLQIGEEFRNEYEKLEGNQIRVFLNKVDGLRESLRKINLNSCMFSEEEIIVNFNIKKS